MPWRTHAHKQCHKELDKLPDEDRSRILEAIDRLTDALDDVGSVDPRKVMGSRRLDAAPDLQPLSGTGVPGSYRLRAGDLRVTLALLPDEEMVVVTAVARRDDATYDRLVERHRTRFHDW